MIENRPDYLVCTCWGVMYYDIIKAIEQGCQDFESLQEKLMVGTGCSSCIPEVQEILDNSQFVLCQKDTK